MVKPKIPIPTQNSQPPSGKIGPVGCFLGDHNTPIFLGEIGVTRIFQISLGQFPIFPIFWGMPQYSQFRWGQAQKFQNHCKNPNSHLHSITFLRFLCLLLPRFILSIISHISLGGTVAHVLVSESRSSWFKT